MSSLLVQTEQWRDNMTTMKDFVDALNKVTAGVLKEDDDYRDLDLDDVGSELDQDDDYGDDKGYSQKPMYDQLGKVLDSQGNPNAVNTVTTDDGKEHKVTPDQARVIRMLMTTDKVKPMVRTQFQKDMQTSSTLADFLDIKDYHEITHLFVKRYLG